MIFPPYDVNQLGGFLKFYEWYGWQQGRLSRWYAKIHRNLSRKRGKRLQTQNTEYGKTKQ